MSDDDRELLTAYLDGELTEADEQALEARLGREPTLRAEFTAMKQTWGLLDYLPKAEASADFTNRTIERLTIHRTRTSTFAGLARRRWLRWLAGSVAALALGVGAGVGLRRAFDRKVADDDAMVSNMRLLERLPLYDAVDDLDFLKKLAEPDLFGDEDHEGR